MAKKQAPNTNTNTPLNTSGLESVFATETQNLKKRDALYAAAQKRLEAQMQTIDIINQKMQKGNNLTKEQVSKIQKTVDAWSKAESIQSKALKDFKDGNISAKGYKKTVEEITKEFDNARKGVKLTGKANKDLRATIASMRNEMKSFGKAVDESAKSIGFMDTALDQVGSSGIPLMRELSDVIKNGVKKNAEGAKLALTALGAAAAGLAMNYFGAEPQAAIKASNDVKQRNIDAAITIGKIENKRQSITARKELERARNRIDNENEVNRLSKEAQFASQRAAIQFGAEMQSNAAEFNAASKTAFFGEGIGSVGYAAGQLQLAGVSAENVAQSLSAASKEFGSRPSSGMAADMAIMATRTGQSAENISSITSFFKRLDKVSAGTALNMVEGMRAMADSANIDLGGMMEEMANASKDALSYQIRSGAALAKQVTYASSIGVSFNDVAKAGKSMVLNYKDSIKNEMQLSAMLGRNVNLSEARALFAQGKNDEALQSIKAQGLDPTNMNMFQQEALQQALGGLDLNSLQKIATTNGKTVSLGAGNVKGGNQGFLSRTQGAQSALAAQQANISAQQAIIDQNLSAKITDAYLNSDGYKKYQANLLTLEKRQEVLNAKEENRYTSSLDAIALAAKAAQLGIERMFKENGLNLVAGVVGGAASNYLGGKLVDKIGGKTAGKLATKATEKAATKATEKIGAKVVEKAAAKSLGKSLLKKIPFLGLGAALFFAADRAMAGDYAGAGMEVASGGASMIPGIGTGASIAMDAAIAARDLNNAGVFDSKNATASVKKAGIVPGNGIAMAQQPSMVLSDVQYQTRLQTEMVALLGMSTGFMKQLLELEADVNHKNVNINGTKLASNLLASARKNYSIARKEVVGAYKAP